MNQILWERLPPFLPPLKAPSALCYYSSSEVWWQFLLGLPLHDMATLWVLHNSQSIAKSHVYKLIFHYDHNTMNMYYIFVCLLLHHALSCILLFKRFWCRERATGATFSTKTAHASFERFLSPNQAHNGCTKAYFSTPMLPGQHGTCGELKNLEKSQFEPLRPTSFTERCSCNLKQPFHHFHLELDVGWNNYIFSCIGVFWNHQNWKYNFKMDVYWTSPLFWTFFEKKQLDLDNTSGFVTKPIPVRMMSQGAGVAAVTEVNSKRWAPSQKLRARWAWHPDVSSNK